jgi:deoxyribodipyrimidine photo-lyase
MGKNYQLWWIKRDFRLEDNAPLTAALALAQEHGQGVLPLFLLDQAILHHPETSSLHTWLISQSLESLER